MLGTGQLEWRTDRTEESGEGVHWEGMLNTFEAESDMTWLCPESHLLWLGRPAKKGLIQRWGRKMAQRCRVG